LANKAKVEVKSCSENDIPAYIFCIENYANTPAGEIWINVVLVKSGHTWNVHVGCNKRDLNFTCDFCCV
jgi:hypothetical protein